MNKPKLKISSYLDTKPSTRICTVEESRNCIEFGPNYIVVAEQQIIKSFEELEQLLNREEYQGQDYVNVSLVQFAEGG